MNRKNIAIAFVVILFLLLSVGIVYIFSELYTESDIKNVIDSKAIEFKDEYMNLNGVDNGNGKTYRSIVIPDDNPFEKVSEDEIVSKMDANESFIVYFGFAKCPWCRSVLESLIKSAKENEINKIYYVDVLGIRDTYELDEKNSLVKTKEGTEGYYKLLERLNNVLSDYKSLTYTKKKKVVEVPIKEKRIYAPNIVVVKNGKALAMETGILDEQTDGYQELSDEMLCKMKEKFDCLFTKLKESDYVCTEEFMC